MRLIPNSSSDIAAVSPAAFISLSLLLLTSVPALAADNRAMSFEDATARLLQFSDALAGAKSGVESASQRAASLDYLDYPRVEFDAKALESEKTFDLDTSKVKTMAQAALPALNPTTGAAVASQIPSTLGFGIHNSGFRSEITTTLPVYTGGKIDATQKAAKAGVHQAGAELTFTEQQLRTQLVKVYFLHQLALKVETVRQSARDGLRLHLDNARKSERAGVIARAQTLQAQVAYDEAERNLVQAKADVQSSGVALAKLLHLPSSPGLATPLFVVTKPLPPVQKFVSISLSKNAQLDRLLALDEQSGEMVRVEHSERLPQVYLFGEYDLSPKNPDLTTPDWAFGLGVKYKLFSGIDRSAAEDAAKHRQSQVQSTIRQTKNDLETAVTNAYTDLEATRDRFLLLDSSIAAAKENVRVQDASFKAGYATSVDVVDARLALSRAEVERAQAAYIFDEALSRLLAICGEADGFFNYLGKADKVIEP